MRQLPNLNAVRAFDAAARHGSFARAADELGVSHAAVSRHVRNLESEMGVELFERHARHIVLTGEGHLFSLTAAEALSSLELDAGRLKRSSERGTVILDIESDLATRWLLPLLTEEVLKTINVTLDVRVRPDPPGAFLGDVDLAVVWGPAACNGYSAEPFMPSQAFPVAAPSLIGSGPDPQDPAFFVTHRLIHQRGVYWWSRYFDALGLDFEDAAGHMFFNRTRLCIDAAVRGLGLAVVSDSIVHDHLKAGALVKIKGPVLPSRGQYYLLTPDTRSLSPRVRAVRNWLIEQASAFNPSSTMRE